MFCFDSALSVFATKMYCFKENYSDTGGDLDGNEDVHESEGFQV